MLILKVLILKEKDLGDLPRPFSLLSLSIIAYSGLNEMVRQQYLIGGQWDMCIGVLTGSLVENGQRGMAILVVAHPSGFPPAPRLRSGPECRPLRCDVDVQVRG